MSINIALGLDASSHQALHIRGMLRQLRGDFLGAMRDYQGWASRMDLTCAEAQQVSALACIANNCTHLCAIETCRLKCLNDIMCFYDGFMTQ